MAALHGGCHCGNLEVELELRVRPEEAEVRACGCSFCRAHGSRNVTDPGGRVLLRAREPTELSRYRFGQRTADFLVCRRCGVYVGAVMAAPDGRLYATINVNALAERARFTREAAKVSYDAEGPAGRVDRRASHWTPAAWEDAGGPVPAGAGSGPAAP